ncbi:hypothetical protein ACM66B_005194 [Microbotryomycetes sp. NB124-2]
MATRWQVQNLSTQLVFFRNKCAEQRTALGKLGGQLRKMEGMKEQMKRLMAENEMLKAQVQPTGPFGAHSQPSAAYYPSGQAGGDLRAIARAPKRPSSAISGHSREGSSGHGRLSLSHDLQANRPSTSASRRQTTAIVPAPSPARQQPTPMSSRSLRQEIAAYAYSAPSSSRQKARERPFQSELERIVEPRDDLLDSMPLAPLQPPAHYAQSVSPMRSSASSLAQRPATGQGRASASIRQPFQPIAPSPLHPGR